MTKQFVLVQRIIRQSQCKSANFQIAKNQKAASATEKILTEETLKNI